MLYEEKKYYSGTHIVQKIVIKGLKKTIKIHVSFLKNEKVIRHYLDIKFSTWSLWQLQIR